MILKRRPRTGNKGTFFKVGSALLLGTCVLVGGFAKAVVSSDPQDNNPADPGKWHGTLLFATSGRYCSSTVVGSRVILTAAQCLETPALESTAVMKTAVGEIGYRIACQAHPDFGTDPSVDFALCYVDQPLPVTRIERIDPTEPIAGAKIPVGSGNANWPCATDSSVTAANAAVAANI
jgi:hypothetical protein